MAMAVKQQIILVEDDAAIAELIKYNLTNEGFDVGSYRSGAQMFEELRDSEGICLFILDIMLPGMDGFEICRRIREIERFLPVPVIMLTARASESDKVKGLEAGADDYVTKPFGIREFLARVHAQVRRYETSMRLKSTGEGSVDRPEKTADTVKPASADAGTPSSRNTALTHAGVIRCADIILDDVKHRVYASDDEIEMTNREYELLKFLMLNRGIAFSRDELLNHVWGYEYSGETRTVDVHIRQLRRKIEKDDANPEYIETVRGRGYRFCEN